MKFGANTFIYHSPFSTDKHLYLVEKYREMGLDLFEMAVEDPALIDLDALKAALVANDMGVIVCGAFGPDRNISSFDPEISKAARDYMVLDDRCRRVSGIGSCDRPDVFGCGQSQAGN